MTHLAELLAGLRRNADFMSQVVAWERIPARPARHAPLPAGIGLPMRRLLEQQGLAPLFTHQAAAVAAVLEGENVVVATRTASGKSLCYTIPVLDSLSRAPQGRALYLFPTKALAQDQLAATSALIAAGELPVTVASYDGDTPRGHRARIRKESQILISNPDMLHAGILPYHTQWRPFFQNLRWVVVDEIHAYRGVFGSHVANVLRRLRRLCAFYDSDPQFICASATIANPREHAEKLVERPVRLIDERQNGAPQGEKQFILFNPPLIDQELGLRRSAILVAKEAASAFIQHGVQTAVFARTRQSVELLLGYLQDDLAYAELDPAAVAGYRGGYLPNERREIEQNLRSGALRGVVATNALELGIDVGELDAVILTGYPGSIASVWQQAGRAGRRAGQAAALMVASNSPLDQYIAHHPRYLFGNSPENALINPDNLRLLVKHLGCAAFELPFRPDENFGTFEAVGDLLEAMREMGLLHETGQTYHWLGDGEVPAHRVSLRTSGSDTVVIQTAGPGPRVIGEIDLESAPHMVYEGAIYLHQADSFQVESFDWDGRLALVRPLPVDYYTRATVSSEIRSFDAEEEDLSDERLLRAHGEVVVVTRAIGYRKIKRYSHETLGFGEIDLPELVLDTNGYWLIFGEALTEALYDAGVLLRPNDYGPNWQRQRRLALERDGFACRTCGANAADIMLHVHHIRPFREYGYVPGENENYRQANVVDNLVSLCPSCHRLAEQGQQARSALGGLAYALRNLAPLFLMCDPSDIEVTAEARHPLSGQPTVVIYERVPAGVGFSQRLFELHDELLAAAAELIRDCTCRDGCPACVGPPGEIGPDTKAMTGRMLGLLRGWGS